LTFSEHRGGDKPAIVGLPDAAVKESLQRLNSAPHNSGYHWPQYRVLINGIAYDAKTDRIFVTGKRWPKVFEIRVSRDVYDKPIKPKWMRW
jgi:hypothetical protein